MNTITGDLQEAVRAITGTTEHITGDLHALATLKGLRDSHVSGRIIALAQLSAPEITTANAAWNYLLANTSLLSAQRNLLSFSSQLDNAAWSKINVDTTGMADVTTAPGGATTAEQLIEDTTSGGHYISRSHSFVENTVYTFSSYFKDKTGDRFPELIFPAAAFTNNQVSNFDLVNGTSQSSNTTLIPLIEFIEDGWWRCSMTARATVTSVGVIQVRLTNALASMAPVYLGNGTSGVYAVGVQLEKYFYPTAYENI